MCISHKILSLLFLFAGIGSQYGFSQLGGTHTYAYLNLPHSARIASLGGKMVPIYDDDLNLAIYNPSFLNVSMDNHFVSSYVNYLADINYGCVAYARNFKKYGVFAASVNYFHYGEFIEANDLGQKLGTFGAEEYSYNFSWTKPVDSCFSFGATFKTLYSSLERYNSLGMAADIGVNYCSRDKLFCAALLLRNMGHQITTYTSSGSEPIPFEIELGISKKLQYAPFRFMFTAHNLQKPDLTYEEPEDDDINLFDEEAKKESNFNKLVDKTLRHIIIGLEFTPFNNFYFRTGYNIQRRKELQIPDNIGSVGFTWGLGLKIYKFHLSYGRARYHIADASNHFSLSINISEFYKKF